MAFRRAALRIAGSARLKDNLPFSCRKCTHLVDFRSVDALIQMAGNLSEAQNYFPPVADPIFESTSPRAHPSQTSLNCVFKSSTLLKRKMRSSR